MKRKTDRTGKEPQVWGKAYAMTLAFFSLEVVLLYLFTIRFS
jgi:hypothetical protein